MDELEDNMMISDALDEIRENLEYIVTPGLCVLFYSIKSLVRF